MGKMTCCLLILAVAGFVGIARGDGDKEPAPASVDNPTKLANGGEPTDGYVEVTVKDIQFQLGFLVRDDSGNYVKNLAASDFQVLENGKPCPVLSVADEEVPINAVIMVDTSISIGTYMQNEIGTAVDFFKNLQNESSAFVLFSETPRVILGWEDPPKDLSSLFQERPQGRTALYDSVVWACENLLKNREGKKLIVLLTDGIDTMSSASFDDMIRATHQHGVVLYPILYTNPYIERFRKPAQEQNLVRNPRISEHFYQLLALQNRFADQTLRWGGRTIFSVSFTDLKNTYEEIIREMKSQYVLLFDSANSEPQDARDISLIAKNGAGKVIVYPFLVLP